MRKIKSTFNISSSVECDKSTVSSYPTDQCSETSKKVGKEIERRWQRPLGNAYSHQEIKTRSIMQ